MATRTAAKRALALGAVLALAGCGSSPPKTAPAPACPQAANGHGQMGACQPAQKLGLTAPRTVAGPTFPDRSNNDPSDMAGVARAGHPALIAKVNQGTGFIDGTYAGMVASARAHKMLVGGYDFAQNYTAAEAYVFIARLGATRTCSGPGVLPPTIDVEFGAFSYAGLLHMIAVVKRVCGRVSIYTGAWYWGPHAGCQWPTGVFGWVSGYPTAPKVCGMPASLYRIHQYTDRGFDGVLTGDMNVYLGSLAQLRAFASVTPKPPACNAACRARKLAPLYRRRTVLRYLLKSKGCRARVAHHQHLGPKCQTWILHGRQTNASIRALGGR